MSASKKTDPKKLTRRKLITRTGMACGTVLAANSLPEQWLKPVINSIVLPAHAQTSVVCEISCLSPATYCSSGDSNAIRLTVSEDGMIQVQTSDGTASAQVDICEGGGFSVTIGANTIMGVIPCGETVFIDVTQSSSAGTTVFTLTKELCSAPPVSCLVPATYCNSGDSTAIRLIVSEDGTVQVQNADGMASTQIDILDGGSLSVTIGANTLSATIPCGEIASIDVTQSNVSGTTIFTLTKELCSAPPMSCLVPATYCEGSGMGSIRVTVTSDGDVTVVHPNGTAMATIDSTTGGNYSVTVMSMGGNTITLSGSIPCGDVDSVELVEDNGSGPTTLTLRKDLC